MASQERGNREQPPISHGKKMPAYRPPSDFRVNVEAGLRTTLSLGLVFLWLGFGPFEGGLSFFAGVTAIVCVGGSAGHTISRSLMMTHGALVGAICAILPRWLMQWGHFPAGAGFFAAVFLVLRSRRLTSLGKKFGCVGVTLLVLGKMSDDGLTLSWWGSAVTFVRVHVEGGVTALVASLLPYPRLATREGALRAQFMCHSLSSAVDACVTGFIKARDETSISRARLLCLQVRQNLEIIRMELGWSRLELGLLFGGFCAGGMQSANALEELSELMEQVLQGVRGMRQSMVDMHRTRAQASFSRVVGSSLRDVSRAVDDTLEATSRRSALLPASILACCHRDAHGTMKNSSVGNNNAAAAAAAATVASTGGPVDDDEERGIRSSTEPSPLRRQSSLLETTGRLEEAVSRMMKDYQSARKEVLYGLDDLGRPLEEAASSGQEVDGGGRSSSIPREPVSLEDLQSLSTRDKLPRTGSVNLSRLKNGLSTTAGEVPASSIEAEVSDEIAGRRREGDPLGGVPNHVLVMKERQKLGSSATMARGAFLFSLSGLCSALAKKRVSGAGGWRPSQSAEAARFVFSGLWTAIRPPPGLLGALSSTAELLAPRCCRPLGSSRSRGHRRKAELALKRLGARSGPLSPASRPGGVREGGCLSAVTRSGYLWCFKVSLALTLCAVFSLSPFLAELFEPSVWISITATFVMDNQSASALSTSLMRLVGTVLGAVYGILAAKLAGQPGVESYSFRTYTILLPWVAVTCFFRNSSQFSYAALVAAFTAVVIFTSSSTVLGADGEAVSLARIVNTVVGSVVYLLVDMLLVPTRAKNLVLEQIYLSLDAAFRELSINGERMFGPVVCPRDSRAQFLRALHRSQSICEPSGGPGAAAAPHASRGGEGSPREAGKKHRRHGGGGSSGSGGGSGGGGGGSGEVSRKDGAESAAGTTAAAAAAAAAVPAESWGRVPAVAELLLLPGFSTEKPGFLDGGGSGRLLDPRPIVSSEHGRDSPPGTPAVGSPRAKSAGPAGSPSGGEDGPVRDEGRGIVDVPSGLAGGRRDGSGAEEGEGFRLEGESAAAAATVVSMPSWGGREKEAGGIRKMVCALALQKRYLPLAELEPQLWFKAFPASAYQDMVAAQEELLRALTLLTKSAIAVSQDRSTEWRRELSELGSRLASLLQLLKIALEDARDVFGGGNLPKAFSHRGGGGKGDADSDGGGGGGGGVWGEEGEGVLRMLDVQADAMRLNADVQSDFVMFIQTFMDRGAFPVWELESILRINTAVLAVVGVQRALLTLGHAVATVVDYELYGSYYR